MNHFKLSFLYCLGFSICLWAQDGKMPNSSLKKNELPRKPSFEVASCGASTTGLLVEGSAGAIRKGYRNRFYCNSHGPVSGFLGPQSSSKSVHLKNQPGIFPAPLMGDAAISFDFKCDDSNACVTPIVVRPDGTVFHGLSMTSLNSPQKVVISSPAQTGIYTLFVLGDQKKASETYVTVDAFVSTQPQNDKTFHLKTFTPGEKDAELISAEFVYTPSN